MAEKPPPKANAGADVPGQLNLFETEHGRGAKRVAARLGIAPAELAERAGLVDCQALTNGGRRRPRKGRK